MTLQVEDVTTTINSKKIISNINLFVDTHQFVGLIGPNGSGKSTLLKSIYRILQPDYGKVYLENKDIYQMSAKKAAQKMAVVSQESPVLFDFSVREIVLMGRAPHKKMFETDTTEDVEIANEALSKVGLEHYAERSFSTLSGGEKQRVMVARALAQRAKILVLDEPTNHLDVHHQLQLMDLLKTLNITVVAALHDLNIASVYCDQIYVIQDGEIAISGSPEKVLTENVLRDVFRVKTNIITHPITGKLHITYLSEQTMKLKEKELIHV